MFEIAPEPEFSRWFESLPERAAEEVASALEVAASAGALFEPGKVSRALLWYDGVGVAPEFASLGSLQSSHAWAAEALRCLESAAFTARLSEVPPGVASQALAAVERFKSALRSARLVVRLYPSSEEPAGLRSLKVDFLEALRLVGLEPRHVKESESGLCELTLADQAPRLRVLFGLDAERRRLVVILGEALTRKYYGDSVRFAERRWSEYLAKRRRATAER